MALNYDFDMFSVIPKAVFDDPALGGFPGEMGFQHNQKGNCVALFRYTATVEALKRAPQALQDYLCASKFGLNIYHSGAPAGRYPDSDEAARIVVIEALAENLGKFDLPRADDSLPDEDAFHLPAFYAALVEAEPMAVASAPAPQTPAPDGDATITDTPARLPHPKGRFQLPKLPRWLTAGAALAVVGVAFGTALI